jgi:hypothetical protein
LSDDDPGWRLSPKMLLVLVPGLGSTIMRRPANGDGLEATRQMWTAFVGSSVLFGVVLLLVVPGDIDKRPAGPWVIGLVTIGLALLGLVRVIERPLQCTDPLALASSYRTRFFLRTAFAQATALLAFVSVFIVNQAWLYWAVLPVALAGHVRNAPTRAHLERDQHELSQRGCALSLVRALRGLDGGGATG